MISAMQSKFPTKRILVGKTDLDAAYFWIHTNATTELTCIAIVDELAFLCLRSPFGTTPSPVEYTTVSEAAKDMGNDLLQDEYWDTYGLNLPHQPLLPQEEKQHSARHLVTTYPLSVDVTATESSMDGFFDNIITITVDDEHWIDCAKKCGSIGHLYTIPTTTAIRTPKTR